MAIKCHSGFVHYNMFHNHHCHGGGNNYGSIFNITNNCGGGTSFWGGFGAGLGLGFGNLLGGLFGGFMGGFGNMFGGFGNMFGMGGLGGFGGWGNGLSGLWGGGTTDSVGTGRDYSEYSSRRSRRSSSCDCGCKDKDVKAGNDKDYPKINEFDAKANKLLEAEKSADNDKKIDELVKELQGYKLLDEAHKADNEKQIKLMIERLQAHRSVPVAAGTDDEQANSAVTAGNDGVATVAADEITIDGKPVKIAGITLAQIETLTPEAIDALDAQTATDVLKELGYINTDGVGQMSANYKVLLLLQKSGVNVQCAKNPNSQDQWVQGKISNVAENNGKVSYTIDNGTAAGDFKFKYSFQQVDDKNGKKCFHLTKIEKNGSEKTGYVENNWKEKDYIYQNEKQPLLTTGDPLISNYSNAKRTKLETELS